MPKSIFITGTDTAVGKTTISCLLLKKLKQLGYKTFAMKPIASGCTMDENNHFVNEDALALQAAASIFKPYPAINPIALKEPIAPHLAAKLMGKKLSVALLTETITAHVQAEADINIIEGVGGWSVPLNETELFSEAILQLNIPTILVVAIKLGCLNHAILTYHNIVQMKVPLLGWVANCIEQDTLASSGNIETLKQWIHAPCLGVVPFRS
ncbi:MAG: bioD [Gammaproteobacteria bacterium]|jgi:dethiobiotin synthetase|nr:bioD [Gammaproteobacteria bacterium]